MTQSSLFQNTRSTTAADMKSGRDATQDAVTKSAGTDASREAK